MSLLSPHVHHDTVTVVLRTMGLDSRNSRVPVEIGQVLATGQLQPATQEDVERYGGTGTSVLDMARFITPEFPGDDISQVITADGRVWDVVGAPTRYRSSRRTSRDVVRLSAPTQKRRW